MGKIPQAFAKLFCRIAGAPEVRRRSAGRPPEVRWRSPRGRRSSAHKFGELGAILAELILRWGSSSEHNSEELDVIMTEVILRRCLSSAINNNFVELGAILAEVMLAGEWSGGSVRLGEHFW